MILKLNTFSYEVKYVYNKPSARHIWQKRTNSKHNNTHLIINPTKQHPDKQSVAPLKELQARVPGVRGEATKAFLLANDLVAHERQPVLSQLLDLIAISDYGFLLENERLAVIPPLTYPNIPGGRIITTNRTLSSSVNCLEV